MDYAARLATFSRRIEGKLDLVYFPISADLEYLTGIPREMPNFGSLIYPGLWVEGAWIAPGKDPIIALPRMTAQFHGLAHFDADVRVLPDADDPTAFMKDLLTALGISAKPRVGLGKKATAETAVALQSIYPGVTLHNATEILMEQRRVKTADEIALMREAGAVTMQAFDAVIPFLRHGMTEQDIVAEVNHQLTAHGAIGPSFTTSMYNSGPNFQLIWGDQVGKWHRPLNPPVSLLFDFGAAYKGYSYDFGRTVFFGAPPAEAVEVHRLVMESQRAGIAALKAGTTGQQVDAAARAVIEEAGYGPLFRHRLGHGIGMDVHEPPFLAPDETRTLEAGMLFTVEPSITQEHSFSARVEDIVLCTPTGGDPLTTKYQELIVIE